MDLTSACYFTKIRPFFDSDILVDIRWFFAMPGAKLFPGWHRFASRKWDSDPADAYPGEVRGKFQFCNGKVPFPIGFDGQKFCGKKEFFVNGASIADIPAALPRIEFVPVCCLPVPLFPPFSSWQAAQLQIDMAQETVDLGPFVFFNTGVDNEFVCLPNGETDPHWFPNISYTWFFEAETIIALPDYPGDGRFSRWIVNDSWTGVLSDPVNWVTSSREAIAVGIAYPILKGRFQVDFVHFEGELLNGLLRWGNAEQNINYFNKSGCWQRFEVDPLGYEGDGNNKADFVFETNVGPQLADWPMYLRLEFGDFPSEQKAAVRISFTSETIHPAGPHLKISAIAAHTKNAAALRIGMVSENTANISAALRVNMAAETVVFPAAALQIDMAAETSDNPNIARLRIATTALAYEFPDAIFVVVEDTTNDVCEDCETVDNVFMYRTNPGVFEWESNPVYLCELSSRWKLTRTENEDETFTWDLYFQRLDPSLLDLAHYQVANVGSAIPETLDWLETLVPSCNWGPVAALST